VLNVIQSLLVSKYAEALYLFETKTHRPLQCTGGSSMISRYDFPNFKLFLK
jgi:hypothetical protein